MPPTENIASDEDARFAAYAEELHKLQVATAGGGRPGRALHNKQHVGALAELTIKANLPSLLPAAQGVPLFAAGKQHRAYVRFSNGSGHVQPDTTADVRGLAVKLTDVPGKKLIEGLEDKPTQDFLLIQTPSVAFKNPEEFMALVRSAAGSKLLLLPRLVGALGAKRTLAVVKRLAKLPQPASLAVARFYTALPVRFGDTAAKLGLFPATIAESSATSSGSTGPQALRDDLLRRLLAGALVYKLCAQLFVDEQTTPIEDSSVDWPEAKSPWVELATLTIPQQDLRSEQGQKVERFVDQASFDPWHSIPELRPLGAMMRARKHAYKTSVIERQAAAEPDGTEVF